MHSPRGQRAKPSAGPALTTPVWPLCCTATWQRSRASSSVLCRARSSGPST
jgi:hypothetical protein